jgi:hypothetical protein
MTLMIKLITFIFLFSFNSAIGDPSTRKLIGNITYNDFFTLIQLPENSDLLDFLKVYSVRLRDANPSRVSYRDRMHRGDERRVVTQGDRRLDALARLLVGDEVCAAVGFDEEGKLYVATNNDGHTCREFGADGRVVTEPCPLFERIIALHTHTRMPHPCSESSTFRAVTIGTILPYLLVNPNTSQKLNRNICLSQLCDAEIADIGAEVERLKGNLTTIPKDQKRKMRLTRKSLKRKEEAIEKKRKEKQRFLENVRSYRETLDSLTEFSKKLSTDFCAFEAANSGISSDDIVEQWVDNLEPRLHELGPPASIIETETSRERFWTILARRFQDLLKVEQFFSPASGKTLAIHPDMMINEGGEGVHAEIRLTAFGRKKSKRFLYTGISKLCCAYCNVVMEHVVGVRYAEEDIELAPVRGHHGTAYPWPMHVMFRASEELLRQFLGEGLYIQYRNMMAISFDCPEEAVSDKGAFALAIIEKLPLLNFDPENKAVAESLGICFPNGDPAHQAADPSIAFSKTPTYFHVRKAFYNFRYGKIIVEGTKEFERAQLALASYMTKGRAKTVLFEDVKDILNTTFGLLLITLPVEHIGNEGLYEDNHIGGLLEYHLSEEDGFLVISPAVTIFENLALLTDAITRAVNAARADLIAVVPIHIHGNHWVGAIFRQQVDGTIQVIYNNPQGYVIDLEPNAIRFVEHIQIVKLKTLKSNIYDYFSITSDQ